MQLFRGNLCAGDLNPHPGPGGDFHLERKGIRFHVVVPAVDGDARAQTIFTHEEVADAIGGVSQAR